MEKSGFSMLELMVVLSIVGILSAIAIPNMDGWSARRNLKGTARDMVSHMNLAKSEAVKGNHDVRIGFDSGTDTYTISDGIMPGRALPNRIHLKADFPVTSTCALDANTGGFNSRGLALKSGTITIVSDDLPDKADDGEIPPNTMIINLTIGGGITIKP